MSNRKDKRQKYEARDSERLRFLLSVIGLDELKRVNILPGHVEQMPSRRMICVEVDRAITRFRKADARLKGKNPKLLRGIAREFDETKELFEFDDAGDPDEFRCRCMIDGNGAGTCPLHNHNAQA